MFIQFRILNTTYFTSIIKQFEVFTEHITLVWVYICVCVKNQEWPKVLSLLLNHREEKLPTTCTANDGVWISV